METMATKGFWLSIREISKVCAQHRDFHSVGPDLKVQYLREDKPIVHESKKSDEYTSKYQVETTLYLIDEDGTQYSGIVFENGDSMSDLQISAESHFDIVK